MDPVSPLDLVKSPSLGKAQILKVQGRKGQAWDSSVNRNWAGFRDKDTGDCHTKLRMGGCLKHSLRLPETPGHSVTQGHCERTQGWEEVILSRTPVT